LHCHPQILNLAALRDTIRERPGGAAKQPAAECDDSDQQRSERQDEPGTHWTSYSVVWNVEPDESYDTIPAADAP
jgi:hypothetical protein